MSQLNHHEVVTLLLSLGVLLACARIMGELARSLNQPAVLGELIAGVLLGPTVLGTLFPALHGHLFPSQGPVAVALSGLTTVAISLFLLVAGMEVDLSTVWRQGRAALAVSLSGIVFPFAVGFLTAWAAPRLVGYEPGIDPLLFALFIATALSISALPVIAKTLMDLNLYRSDLGMIVIAAAIFDDLTGWIVFAIILASIGRAGAQDHSVGLTIGMTLAFAGVMLTAGRHLIHRALPWIQAHASWPGGVLGFALSLALLAAAFTEWIGIHAVFGAFLAGVAIGDSAHLRESIRKTIGEFVSFIFAPLFFASVGLRVNFVEHFDWKLTVVVLLIACIGKVLGCRLGAAFAGVGRREAWALGFGMNARGAMEIILGLLAMEYGVISRRLFVTLVVMALVTSMMSGPLMQRILRLARPRRITHFLSQRSFVSPLSTTERRGSVRLLAQAAATAAGLPPEEVDAAVWTREEIMSTGVGNGIAVPHARIAGLASPVIALGLSKEGIDFNAPDGEPARLIFLILTATEDNGAQVEILSEIARTFRSEEARGKAVCVGSYTEFLALMNTSRVI